MSLLFRAPFFLYLMVSLLSHHIQESQSSPIPILGSGKRIISSSSSESLLKKPQSTTTFALQQEKDDLEDEYVMIGKLTPDLMNSMIRPQSSRRLYSKKKLQANELIDPEVEDYIYVDRKQIPEYHSKTDVKIIQSDLEKGQSSQNIAGESKEENRLNEGSNLEERIQEKKFKNHKLKEQVQEERSESPKLKEQVQEERYKSPKLKGEVEEERYKSAKLKEQVQEKSYKSVLTQEVKAGNEKQEVVKEELDSMWFWNEEKELKRKVFSMPELREEIECFLNSKKEDLITNLKKLGEKLEKERNEETKVLLELFLESLLKRKSDDQGRLEDIQDDLKKILVDYKKIKPANHNGSKKQEKMNPPLVIFGIKIGGNLNRLPPDHKVNRKLSRVA